MTTIWGIDLGGTKIEGIVLHTQNNEVLARIRLATEAHLGYQHILHQIKRLLEMLAEKVGHYPTSVGFSTPGVLNPSTQTMKNCNTTCMNGQAMKQDIEQLLGISAVLANDANCFALAETNIGVVKEQFPEAKVVFGLIMGTGVGGGLVVNGKIIEGKHGIGGEWGHNVLINDGPLCYCGKKGCNEMIFSGPKIEEYYQALSGKSLSMKEIYAAHQANTDILATQSIRYLCTMFGRAISSIINTIDPDVVVIGGGLGNIDELYSDGVSELKSWIFNNGLVETAFVKPKLGDSAGVFGAAELVRNNE